VKQLNCCGILLSNNGCVVDSTERPLSESTPGRKTTPAAKPIGIDLLNQPVLVPRKPTYRLGAMDYQRCNSLVNGKPVPYHVQDADK